MAHSAYPHTTPAFSFVLECSGNAAVSSDTSAIQRKKYMVVFSEVSLRILEDLSTFRNKQKDKIYAHR